MDITVVLILVLQYLLLVFMQSLASIIMILVGFIFSIFSANIFYSLLRSEDVRKREINILSIVLPTCMSLYPSMQINLALFGLQFSDWNYFLHIGGILSVIGFTNYILASFVLSRYSETRCIDMI